MARVTVWIIRPNTGCSLSESPASLENELSFCAHSSPGYASFSLKFPFTNRKQMQLIMHLKYLYIYNPSVVVFDDSVMPEFHRSLFFRCKACENLGLFEFHPRFRYPGSSRKSKPQLYEVWRTVLILQYLVSYEVKSVYHFFRKSR